MTKILKPLLACLLITFVFGQIVNLSQIYTPQTQATLGPEFQDPEFLKLVNNYFGCKTWKDGACLECSSSYIFNKNGICCLIDQHCQNFNRDMGVCELCYTGYSVDANGTCTLTATDDKRVGCAQWSNNICQACSAKYYFGADNICLPVNDDCREWNTTTGECTQCYSGYELSQGSCVLQQAPSTAESNPQCKTWKGLVCQECAQRAYFDANGICQTVNAQCQTWDLQDGLCLSCYRGYDLENGTCVYSSKNTALVTDPGCRTWNGSVCLECSSRWVFDKTGACIPVNDLCRTHDDQGVCFTCYPGYTLVDGACQFIEEKLTDLGCAKWDRQTLTCSSCSNSWVFNDNGICVQVSDSCRTHDSQGLCTGCFRGYEFVNGTCTFTPYQTVQDEGCKVWNWQTNTCSECSAWWHLDTTSGLCIQVSDLCKTYTQSGACDSCYRGFDLNEGLCVVSPIASPSDLGCKTWKNDVCIQCSENWVFNNNNVCVAVSDQCKTHDNQGNCLTCYPGYGVVNGTCEFLVETVPDVGCKTWDWNNKVCQACSDRYVINSNGNCVAVSDQCRVHDSTTGVCTGCYRGYDLITSQTANNYGPSVVVGECILSTNNLGPTDLGCKIWDWEKQVCTQCSFGWFFNSGQCVVVSPYCKSSDATTGQCLTCYLGYDLSEGNCVYSSSNTAAPSDVGCKTWNSGVCTECSLRWHFNENNICVPVSDFCKTHEGNLCTSCFNGYVLVNGTCQVSPLNSIIPTDAGCKNWDWNSQKCLECSNFWYFNNGVCTPVSDLCKTYDSTTGLCLSCFKGYALVNGTCNVQDRAVSDVGCAEWDWDNNKCLSCSKQWYFNSQGACTAVSPYCKSYDASTGACTSCFSGYALNNGVCSVSLSFCKASNEDGCVSCYNGFALYQKKCISLDNIANIALYYAECCPQKLAQLKADGRIPQ